MTRVLFDTNVVLDVLLHRAPWHVEADILWQANDARKIEGFISPTTITDIWYIARKLPTGPDTGVRAVQLCLAAFNICPVSRSTLEFVLALPGSDFEDHVQVACVQQESLDAIVTRDAQGFRGMPCTVLTPSELITQLP
jgi:predicted nucleic acid-binding protein